MKIYIDCVSGYSHLIHWKSLVNTDSLWSNDREEINRVIDLFKNCYCHRSVPCKKGCNVIDSSILLDNIKCTIDALETDLHGNVFDKIIELTFQGMYCSKSWMSYSWEDCELFDPKKHSGLMIDFLPRVK